LLIWKSEKQQIGNENDIALAESTTRSNKEFKLKLQSLYLWWLLLGACLPWFTETIGIFRVIWKERHTSCTFFWLNPSINFVCVINYYLSPTLGFPNTTRSRRAKPFQVSLLGEVNQRTNVSRLDTYDYQVLSNNNNSKVEPHPFTNTRLSFHPF
jgi:hypothetical protein